jgi:translation initiation factor IF-1
VSGDVIVAFGRVTEANRGGVFRVEVPELHRTVLARRSGKLVKNSIRILVADEVEAWISPYDLNRGRIVHRGPRRDAAARFDRDNRERRPASMRPA